MTDLQKQNIDHAEKLYNQAYAEYQRLEATQKELIRSLRCAEKYADENQKKIFGSIEDLRAAEGRLYNALREAYPLHLLPRNLSDGENF